jgi:hypothetical protein
MAKRTEANRLKCDEEQQILLTEATRFGHFTVNTKHWWLTNVIRTAENEPIGAVYSHRLCHRPLILQMLDGQYMVGFQRSLDDAAFQMFTTEEGEKIEEAIQIINECYALQADGLMWILDEYLEELTEAAVCEFLVGPMHLQVPKPVPVEERRVVKAKRTTDENNG